MEPSNLKQTKRVLFSRSLLSGIAWGIGATIGVSLVLALVALFVRLINPIPVVGEFVSGVYEYVMQNNPRIRDLNY